jgi:Transposase DDE domain
MARTNTIARLAVMVDAIGPPSATGRPRTWSTLAMVQALCRAGAAWKLLPESCPPRQTIGSPLERWIEREVLECALSVLNGCLRLARGRKRRPSAGILDTQSVRTGPQRGPRGYDAGKKVKGRKRVLLVDSEGLVHAIQVIPASVHFTPTASSWLNQVERFFALLTARRLKCGVHRSVEELEAAVLAYVERQDALEQRPSRGSDHPAQATEAADVRPRRLRPAPPSHPACRLIHANAGEPSPGGSPHQPLCTNALQPRKEEDGAGGGSSRAAPAWASRPGRRRALTSVEVEVEVAVRGEAAGAAVRGAAVRGAAVPAGVGPAGPAQGVAGAAAVAGGTGHNTSIGVPTDRDAPAITAISVRRGIAAVGAAGVAAAAGARVAAAGVAAARILGLGRPAVADRRQRRHAPDNQQRRRAECGRHRL